MSEYNVFKLIYSFNVSMYKNLYTLKYKSICLELLLSLPSFNHNSSAWDSVSDSELSDEPGQRKSSISLWTERWFLSSNAKDIGVLYLIFSLFSGLIGTAFSVLIRLELSGPGVQYIADNQLYNAIITAHAILMRCDVVPM